MASFQKYKTGWRCFVLQHGERHSKVFSTKKEAQAWAVEMEAALRPKVKGWHTFREAAERYMRDVSSLKSDPAWERRRIKTFIEFFGDKRLGEIDTPDTVRWRDERLKTVSGSTVNREKNILSHIFNVARSEWKWMDHHVFDGVKMPKENDARHQRWTWQLIKRVLRAGQRTGGKTLEVTQAFHISLRTGMRLKECLQAPQRFDKRRQVVVLLGTKTAMRDEVPVGRIAARLLDREPFTVSANLASTMFSKLNRELLIDGLTFHDARATALTLLSRKVTPIVLGRISRHRNLNLLMNVYYRETTDEISARI